MAQSTSVAIAPAIRRLLARPVWQDADDLEASCCYVPFSKAVYGGADWLIQRDTRVSPYVMRGTSPYGQRVLSATNHAVRNVWQVSATPVTTRMVAFTWVDATHNELESTDNIFGTWLHAGGGGGVALGDTGTLSALDRSLVDLGSVSGGVLSGYLLFFTYTADTKAPAMYFSLDGGVSWGNNPPLYNDGDPIFSLTNHVAGGPIRHFHGAILDPDEVGATYRLYVMTGDSTTPPHDEASILVCEDILGANGLIANPALWLERWALRDADTGVREAQLAANPNYSLVVDGTRCGSQGSRTVAMTPSGDYLVWVDDRGEGEVGEATASHVYRMNRTSRVVESIGRVIGTGRGAITTADGHALWFTSSERTGGAYKIGHDEYMRCYLVDGNRSEVRELRKWKRSDVGSESAASCIIPCDPYEAMGHIWLGPGWTLPDAYYLLGIGDEARKGVVGRVTTLEKPIQATMDTAPFGLDALRRRGSLNMISEGRPADTISKWTATGCALAFDNTVICPFVESLGSWKITPNAATATVAASQANVYPAAATATVDDLQQEMMAGGWWTFSGWLYLPSTLLATQIVKARFYSTNSGIYDFYVPGGGVVTASPTWFDDAWHRFAIPIFIKQTDAVPPPARDIGWYVYAHSGAVIDANPIWFSGVQCVQGVRPNWAAFGIEGI